MESPIVIEGGGRIVAWRGSLWHASTVPEVDLERCVREGESPVGHASGERRHARLPSQSRVVWDCSLHLKLNIGARPIVDQYIPQGTGEKHFEKRVQEGVKLLGGNAGQRAKHVLQYRKSENFSVNFFVLYGNLICNQLHRTYYIC